MIPEIVFNALEASAHRDVDFTSAVLVMEPAVQIGNQTTAVDCFLYTEGTLDFVYTQGTFAASRA